MADRSLSSSRGDRPAPGWRFSSWVRVLWSAVGLLIAYYAFPVNWEDSVGVVVLSLALTALGLGLLGWMMVKELDNLLHGQVRLSTQTLVMLLILLVMSFSLTFFLVNLVDPDQVTGLTTRTDALYFTLSTMATVGYGDVHAVGQLARVLVCGLIVFNVAVVASLVRAHTATRQPADGA